MASTIAAITTGIGGIVTTADATGNLSLLSGTSTIVAVTSAGAAVTGTMSISGATTLTGGLNTPLAVTSGGTGVATSTGSGANVLGTSPTLTTPILGTPTSGNLANCTGIPAPAALSTASGSAPSYSARAWVSFNGTGTVAIRASGNVSSITDNGTGDYTVNFTTAMADANYGATASARGEGNVSRGAGALINIPKNAVAPTTSAIRLTVGAGATSISDGSLVDVDFVNVAIFR